PAGPVPGGPASLARARLRRLRRRRRRGGLGGGGGGRRAAVVVRRRGRPTGAAGAGGRGARRGGGGGRGRRRGRGRGGGGGARGGLGGHGPGAGREDRPGGAAGGRGPRGRGGGGPGSGPGARAPAGGGRAPEADMGQQQLLEQQDRAHREDRGQRLVGLAQLLAEGRAAIAGPQVPPRGRRELLEALRHLAQLQADLVAGELAGLGRLGQGDARPHQQRLDAGDGGVHRLGDLLVGERVDLPQ